MAGLDPATAIANAITSISDAFKGYIDKLPTIKTIGTLKAQEKAINYAEKIIFLADETDLKNSKEYQHFREKFFKYN